MPLQLCSRRNSFRRLEWESSDRGIEQLCFPPVRQRDRVGEMQVQAAKVHIPGGHTRASRAGRCRKRDPLNEPKARGRRGECSGKGFSLTTDGYDRIISFPMCIFVNLLAHAIDHALLLFWPGSFLMTIDHRPAHHPPPTTH